ncbi:MAG: radical SAM protein [Spirochaetales bacterium]|nr:radical SAM protein [Spirochaetales bacterium]
MIHDALSIEVTTHCTLNCLHCFVRSPGRPRAHIPFDRAVAVLEEGRQIGFSRLHLTGGEPLLYPRLRELILRSRELGYGSVFMNTNGQLLDEETADFLAARENVEISVSLNGPEPLHDYVRGKGSCAAVLKGLAIAGKASLPVHVFTVVDRNNIEGLPLFTDGLFREFPSIRDLTFIQLRSGPEGESRKLSPDMFLSLVRQTALLSLGGYAVQILENPLSTAAARKMGYGNLPPSPPISREGRIIVFADGAIGDNHSSGKRFGLYRDGLLKEVYRSSPFTAVRSDRAHICRECPHSPECRQTGLINPSDEDHNRAPYSIPFCRKVLDLI